VSLRKAQVRSIWALGVLAVALHGGWAQNSTSTPPAAVTPDPTASSGGPSQTQAVAQDGSKDKASAPATTSAPRAPAGNAAKGAAASHANPLDLTTPDIRTVVPAEELKEPLPTEEQQAQAEDSDSVEVKSAEDTPDVPGGFGALWWALRHPTQAWRIFTPVE
jgi:hypothetical protein